MSTLTLSHHRGDYVPVDNVDVVAGLVWQDDTAPCPTILFLPHMGIQKTITVIEGRQPVLRDLNPTLSGRMLTNSRDSAVSTVATVAATNPQTGKSFPRHP